MGRPAVFLDRDGTIIEDLHYLHDPDRVRLLPGADRAVARLTGAGLRVVIVTNQSGIGRAYYSEADFAAVQVRVDELIENAGGRILATYHCPHEPTRVPPCDCRKPAPGLFLRAAREHDIDLARSVWIGDRMRDLEAGVTFGGTCYLVRPSNIEDPDGVPASVEIVDSLGQAVDLLLGPRSSEARGALD